MPFLLRYVQGANFVDIGIFTRSEARHLGVIGCNSISTN